MGPTNAFTTKDTKVHEGNQAQKKAAFAGGLLLSVSRVA